MALANRAGKIVFEHLAKGTYRIRVSATGFQEKLTDSLMISASTTNM